MEIQSQEEVEEGEMPLPLNISTYGGGGHGHMIHHHDHSSSNGPTIISTSNIIEDIHIHNHNHNHVMSKKNMVKYRECMKNHAAAMGGNARDGCGEFMPSGEEGTLEALTCSACNCHRNFHRKEIEVEPSPHFNRIGRKVIVGLHHQGGAEPIGYPMIMSYNMGSLPSDQSDDQMMMAKKRFRTKFTKEQKEKMVNFAEKVGWKIQKQEEAVVQQLCQELGVKRRVLKVWMHNNKHILAKKDINNSIDPQNQLLKDDPMN